MYVNVVFKFVDNFCGNLVSFWRVDLYFLDSVVKNFALGQTACGGAGAGK
jgi:hypothetical protein